MTDSPVHQTCTKEVDDSVVHNNYVVLILRVCVKFIEKQ